jgi:glycerol uptake facilitator-like aquaporin
MKHVGKYFVEFVATMVIMFVILAAENVIISSIALGICILLSRPISGGVFNPAVAISLYSDGRMSKRDVWSYIIVEILGSLTGFYAYTKYKKYKMQNKYPKT